MSTSVYRLNSTFIRLFYGQRARVQMCAQSEANLISFTLHVILLVYSSTVITRSMYMQKSALPYFVVCMWRGAAYASHKPQPDPPTNWWCVLGYYYLYYYVHDRERVPYVSVAGAGVAVCVWLCARVILCARHAPRPFGDAPEQHRNTLHTHTHTHGFNWCELMRIYVAPRATHAAAVMCSFVCGCWFVNTLFYFVFSTRDDMPHKERSMHSTTVV